MALFGLTKDIKEERVFVGASFKTRSILPTSSDWNASDTSRSAGSSSTDSSTARTITTDRAIKIRLNREDADCVWAYENDTIVYNAVRRFDGIVNSGFVTILHEDSDKAKEASKLLLKRVTDLKLRQKITFINTMRCIYGFAFLRKYPDTVLGISKLVELDSEGCVPIRNLQTNELGGSTGLGLAVDRPEAEIALVQQGFVNLYKPIGAPISTIGTSYSTTQAIKYFYFTRDEIIPFSNWDRGKFKGTSPIKRVLRLVEIKKSLENVVDLLARRYGPQIIGVLGNADVNFSNIDVPPTYLRDATTGQPIDITTARDNYKKDVIQTIQTNIADWADSDTLMQLAEYGLDIKVLNPTSAVMDYAKYIDQLSDAIKTGILGLDLPGRVDVTSDKMQERLSRDLKDIAMREKDIINGVLAEDFTKPILRAAGYDENIVSLILSPPDRVDDEREAQIELSRSETIYNYAKAGFTKIPSRLMDKWEIKDIEGSMVTMEQQKNSLNQNINDNPNNRIGRKRLEDINKGR